MSVTKAVMDRWQPDQLILPSIGKMAQSVRSESQAADRLFDLPRDSWDGDARNAATARAGDQSAWAGRVSAKLAHLEATLSQAAGAISPAKEAVNSALVYAAGNNCHLISPTDPAWALRYSAPDDDEDELSPSEIANLESGMTSYVMARVSILNDTVNDHANTIRSALDRLRGLTPPNLGLSAQDGRRDANLGDDDWTDAELKQVGENLRAAGLTDEQISRVMNGEKVHDIPEGAQEYLHQFYNNMSAKELFALNARFGELDGNQAISYSNALGNGLLQLSNENIGRTGGFDHLPMWAQDWANNHNSNLAKRIRGIDVPMAKLLGNTTAIPGERLGTELIRKAAGGASRTGSGLIDPTMHYGEVGELYDSTLRTFLEAGTRNHEASAAILSGYYSDGSALTDFKRDDMVAHLVRHEWADDGRAVGKLLDWIDDSGTSGDTAKIALADRAFQGFFDYATTTQASDGDNNFNDLMDAQGNDAVGKVNPHLADALRQAANPYLNKLGGYVAPTDLHVGFNPGEGDDLQRRTARLFTIISSDDYIGDASGSDDLSDSHRDGRGAGADLYRDLLNQVQENGSTAGRETQHDRGYDGGRGHAEVSANLLKLGQAGLFGAQYDLQLDADATKTDTDAANEKATNAIGVATTALGFVPGGQYIAGIADAATPYIFDSPDTPDIPLTLPNSDAINGIDTAREQELLYTYGLLHGADIPRGDEDWYSEDGTLKPLPQIMTLGDDTLSKMEEHLRKNAPERLLTERDRGWSTGNEQGELTFDPKSSQNYEDRILK